MEANNVVPLDRAEKAIEDITRMMRSACGDVGHPAVYRTLAEAAWLHAQKNKGYRSAADPLANFHEARAVKKRFMTALQYAHTLMEKQDDALCALVWSDKAVFEERGGEAMFRERALDGIVYRAILLAELAERSWNVEINATPRP